MNGQTALPAAGAVYGGPSLVSSATWGAGIPVARHAGTDTPWFALTVKPTEALTLGALLFDFKALRDRAAFNLDGRELDLYAEWAAH